MDASYVMPLETSPTRANNFSTLRILFAVLVILSHSYELIDGNRSREILTRIFGTISFGSFAVDGFFVVSGYLIAQSYAGSTNTAYLIKRILRIYPGFILAFIISVVLCEYVSFHSFTLSNIQVFHNIVNLIFLGGPILPNGYPGFPFGDADGVMWTISYEFHCYLMLMLLGILGILRRRFLLLAVTSTLIAAYALYPDTHPPAAFQDTSSAIAATAGWGTRAAQVFLSLSRESPAEDLRFAAIFLAGTCFYQFRTSVQYRPAFAGLAGLLVLACMFSSYLAEPGLAIFGGYIVFWFALHAGEFRVSEFFNRTDLSYGIYLYSWPVQKVLIFTLHGIAPMLLFCLSLPLTAAVALASWTLIERPALRLKPRPPHAPQQP